ncbi:hypothetical protein KQ302_02315 [Synechococcus sp. CS-602]|uniref:hypothetical protein n=1 Tax=Synechococcus sp. CS-602 TaxID=2847982 RepID=UPI00223C219C|nr:hypothetical protein [Synechococcus sp. CS-602]MCT0203952.1 hypothetical protein [Synechococcus sp. CS-602]
MTSGRFDSDSFDQAYRAVELAYSEGRFQDAFRQADALLQQQGPGESDPRTQRLQLILGHIHLHGLQQPELAIPHYQTVLESGNSVTYRELAEQGLALCQEALVEKAVEKTNEPSTVAPGPAADLRIEAVSVDELRPVATAEESELAQGLLRVVLG